MQFPLSKLYHIKRWLEKLKREKKKKKEFYCIKVTISRRLMSICFFFETTALEVDVSMCMMYPIIYACCGSTSLQATLIRQRQCPKPYLSPYKPITTMSLFSRSMHSKEEYIWRFIIGCINIIIFL